MIRKLKKILSKKDRKNEDVYAFTSDLLKKNERRIEEMSKRLAG